MADSGAAVLKEAQRLRRSGLDDSAPAHTLQVYKVHTANASIHCTYRGRNVVCAHYDYVSVHNRHVRLELLLLLPGLVVAAGDTAVRLPTARWRLPSPHHCPQSLTQRSRHVSHR